MGIPGLGAAEAILQIKTKEGAFLVLGMTGHEHLGQMFEYTVELAYEEGGLLASLPGPFGAAKESMLHKLLGTRATLTMDAKDDPRYFDGFISRIKRGEKRGRYDTYTLTLQPWLWFLTRAKTSRIFQEKSVKDIVSKVLKDYSNDSDWRLDSESDYPKLDYCVQHNETDFDFVSRLLEEAGIYYFFEHEEGTHTMVLIDSMGKHKSRKGDAAIKWANAMQTSSTITDWHVQEEVRSVKTVLTDYDYLDPDTEIEGKKSADKEPEKLGDLEWFEHPARVVQNSAKPDASSASSVVTQRATVRMEELVSLYATATGATNVRDLGTGMTFELDNATTKDDNGDYLMVSAVYRLDFADVEAGEDFKEERRREGYRCEFLAISKKAPNYRSPRITPRPVIAGPQTAVVVSELGQGDRDRQARPDQGPVPLGSRRQERREQLVLGPRRRSRGPARATACSRCRASATRSSSTSSTATPTGRWSPARSTTTRTRSPGRCPTTPPWAASRPAAARAATSRPPTSCASRTRRTSEYVWFHGQKDFHRVIENDAFDYVGNNETVKVELTRNEVIGENWFMDVTEDVMHHVGKDLHVNVDGDIFFTGAATWQMKIDKDVSAKAGGDLGIEVGGKTQLKSQADIALQTSTGKLSLKADVGDLMAEGMTIKIKGATTVAIEAGISVSLKAGASFVNVGPAGVDIVGPLVKVNSGGSAGSAGSALKASPTAPTEAKKEASLDPAQASSYDENFDDPMDAGAAP